MAQDTNPESEREARAALEKFFDGWNKADNDAMRATLNCPHLTLTRNGQVTVAQTPADFFTDFTGMREREGWHHSTLDSFKVLHSTADQVYCEVVFSRYKADNTKYMTGLVLYIMTKKDNHWGMQVRSPIKLERKG